MPTFNDSQENIRKEIEFYRDKMNKKLINKVKQSNNINQTKFAIVNDCLSMIISAKPKITDRNKEFWSLTEKLLSITSDFCYYPDDNLAEIVIELHNRLKNMPDSPCEGEELHLPGLQVLILEKYIDYAENTAKSKCILRSGLKNYTILAWHNTINRYIECNDNSLELNAIKNMFQNL
ncbi:42303_t:CDS:1 [Gigaspora margarita]|uniref:42303_t:CDS:1 n=1 Tax=Gigaspora margarita TaxID=4874 RepID=A0ABN7VWH2_GIGMA|nr:42303_t:CDS:1 [Gigaspora margarita]